MADLLTFAEALKNGIRRDERQGSNTPFLEAVKGLRSTEWGLRDFHAITAPMTTPSPTLIWPWPQLFRGKKHTHFAIESALYKVNETTWVGTLAAPKNVFLRGTADSITPGGGLWHCADFHDFQLWCNGQEVIIGFPDSDVYWLVDERIPQTCCNHKDGRVLLGGFPNGASWWNSNAETQAWLTSQLTSGPDVVNDYLNAFNAGDFQNWIWWGTIGSSDVLGLWLLEYLYHGNVTWDEQLTNGDFSAGDLSGWNADPEWTYSGGKAVHAATFQSQIDQQDVVAPGFRYYYSVTTSGRTAGTLQILVLGAVNVSVSTNTTTTGYFVGPAGQDAFNLIASATFDGAIDDVKLIRLGADLGYTADNPWSRVLAKRNESGMMPLPVRGQVQRMLPLGDAIICYTDDGVCAVVSYSSPVSTYGVREIENLQHVGIAGRGAANGGEQGQLMMDTSGSLWFISKDLTAERIGYQEIFVDFLSYSPVIEYDEQHQEWYISADIATGYSCYVFSRNGALSASPIFPTSITYLDGGLISGATTDASGDPDAVELTTGRFRSQVPRRVAQITHITLVTVDTDATGWSLQVDYRLDVGASWTASETFVTDARGHVFCKVAGIEFRIRLSHPDRTKADLDDIIVELDNGEERKSLSRILP